MLGRPPPSPTSSRLCPSRSPRRPGSEAGTPFKNHIVPATGTTPCGADTYSHRLHEAIGWREGVPGKKNVLWQPHIKGWREESPIKL